MYVRAGGEHFTFYKVIFRVVGDDISPLVQLDKDFVRVCDDVVSALPHTVDIGHRCTAGICMILPVLECDDIDGRVVYAYKFIDEECVVASVAVG